jgi:hypothetical protein
MIPKILLAAILLAVSIPVADAREDRMQLPDQVRAWYRNPDGSCVQCSLGMCGCWSGVPEFACLLWDTDYGPKVRGGSWPQRVSGYASRLQVPIWNVTGSTTWEWMRWAGKTGRFAAIGAGGNHFQTLYGYDDNDTPDDLDDDVWLVCNNNSTHKIDRYTWSQFRRLHLASGQWVVILDAPGQPPVPQYVQWW